MRKVYGLFNKNSGNQAHNFYQYYVNFPIVIAVAMNFSNGDIVEWEKLIKIHSSLKEKT
jgi:hypothetical protein